MGVKAKENNPFISVLIPTYNREKYIAEAIESVLAQDYRPIEIIV
ncbi:MAG: glycosyltransferase family 2 protein, partial [Rickettsiales bacterium]|nr:glycosyltransferase family 2 protein [Rickettsiales bacterium]